MELYEILDLVNDNCLIDIYSAQSNEIIGAYDGKESIPEEYTFCNITDIFTDIDIKHSPVICIEIDTES